MRRRYVPPLSAMGIADNLLDDERIVLELHPHWKTLLKQILLLIVIVVVAVVLVVLIPWGSHRLTASYVIAAVAVILALVSCLVPFLRWITTEYVLTTRRLLLRDGILNREGRDIPLMRVNDVSFSHGIIDRMLGCGTLTVESAGEHGQIKLKEIPHVEHVQSQMYELVEEEQQRLYHDDDNDAPHLAPRHND